MEYTPVDIWKKRQIWIDEECEKATIAGHAMSDYVLVLFQDMSRAYCARVWLSVIVMSIAVIDAHLREDVGDNKMGTAELLSNYYEGEDIDWLRKLCNKVMFTVILIILL